MILVLDIDCTLADARPRLKAVGRMPGANTREFQSWLDRLQKPGALFSDPPIRGVCELVQLLGRSTAIKIVYLTGREEKHYDETVAWLLAQKLPMAPLFMRSSVQAAARLSPREVKEPLIKQIREENPGAEIVVLDDDMDGDCGRMYRRHGCAHLKVGAPFEVKGKRRAPQKA